MMFDKSHNTQFNVQQYKSNESDISFPKATILIIEDDDIVHELIRKMMIRLGYTALTASDGPSGLAVYTESNHMIDLVILDLSMPIMSGDKVLSELIAIRPDVKVLISTGANESEVDDELLSKVCCYLSKPYRFQEIAFKVKSVLNA